MTEPRQKELALPFPELTDDTPLMPASMVQEYVYCPRLAYLQWVQGEWADNAETVEGQAVHKRVDSTVSRMPTAAELSDDDRLHARSITLSSNRLGLIARLDLIEVDNGEVTPVEYKRGKRPHIARGAHDPERVQLCVQAMLLEEHGYPCQNGVIYYAGSKERVNVPIDNELRDDTINAISGLRLIADGGQMPKPLEDSPKCPRCSLVGICLPDETNYLQNGEIQPRPLATRRDEAMPVYVQSYHASVRKKGETLEIRIDDEKVSSARLGEISQLVLMGNIYLTTPTLHELMRREIPVSWFSYSGWFLGHSIGVGHKNVELRTAQYQASFDDHQCLRLARAIVHAKILNARTLLRRNWRSNQSNKRTLQDLKHEADRSLKAASLGQLLGIEGNAAAHYFANFSRLLKKPEEQTDSFHFHFQTRNRRPPRDPVNALLSYAYALLVKTWTVTLSSVGFDPYRGFYHQPRYGRPALALDMMEPFRPLIAESTVIQAINNGEIKPTDFKTAAGAVSLDKDGRKRFIAAFERRMSHEITHPLFGYKLSYRRLFEIEARLLGRHLLGEMPEYKPLTTR